jgi:hypothetical protein
MRKRHLAEYGYIPAAGQVNIGTAVALHPLYPARPRIVLLNLCAGWPALVSVTTCDCRA